ncbi:MAG: tRNA preQ1(34) S-adenosylmethionine ribosyltransferase-isomerase QueA [Planctomycetota bacterium]|nr:MAG: tRNA preQ1(34) S-adenosylmethionine ribosyltransferase-isomerase QueA [Planctomycetota bacterium]REK43127.1 MAG: tRNA preQ1(34) S-adenosylmethionine ribosyltransferase-isomerase QueA [Planctomycetota bacterium]
MSSPADELESELDRYDYELPRERIAQYPAAQRSDARLMLVDRGRQSIEHHHVRDLPELLAAGDRLVLNNTRVIPARLIGRRDKTEGRWEGLYLESDEHGLWRMLAKTRGRVAPGETVTLLGRGEQDDIQLSLVQQMPDRTWVVLPQPEEPVLDVLNRVGRVPLPHYIRRGEMIDNDQERYQTVYASEAGSVAAPTAGLHFTQGLLEKLTAGGIEQQFVTLHVSLDTFRPITGDSLDQHTMHTEWGSIGADTVAELNAARERGGRIVAVGTTSVRVLESAAADGQLAAWTGQTDLFIRPPYEYRAVDALMTNFHLPRTTLLVLVRTFGGDELIMRAYQEAIDAEYRFYSYGDAMLIL